MFLNLKKILTAALLLIVAVPLFFSAGFLIKQKLIQHQMKERLEKVSLQTVTLPLSDIRWIKKNKEISIDGNLFDVKSITVSGNNAIITGLYDFDENKLHKVVKNLFQQKSKQPSPFNNLVVKFFSTPITITSSTVSIIADWHYISQQHYKYSEKIPIPPFSADILPPKL